MKLLARAPDELFDGLVSGEANLGKHDILISHPGQTGEVNCTVQQRIGMLLLILRHINNANAGDNYWVAGQHVLSGFGSSKRIHHWLALKLVVSIAVAVTVTVATVVVGGHVMAAAFGEWIVGSAWGTEANWLEILDLLELTMQVGLGNGQRRKRLGGGRVAQSASDRSGVEGLL